MTSAADLRNEPTVRGLLHPGYEGANIGVWIGFKHFMYLAEQAVLAWFRERGLGPATLFTGAGLGLEILDSSVQLPATLEIDDEVRAEVTREGRRFAVRLFVFRDGGELMVLKGRIVVGLIAERFAPSPPNAGLQPDQTGLADLVVTRLRDAPGVAPARDLPLTGLVGETLVPDPAAAFLWSWRASYFMCHFSDRVQHSAYVRALEEVVDRFLADRGISVGRMLAERAWIPVVSRARVRLAGAALMEETVHTVFRVGEILRRTMFEATMDCYVERGPTLVHVATATILHGYAVSRGDHVGTLTELDDDVTAALTGRPW